MDMNKYGSRRFHLDYFKQTVFAKNVNRQMVEFRKKFEKNESKIELTSIVDLNDQENNQIMPDSHVFELNSSDTSKQSDKILVVDDDESIREIMPEMLSFGGYHEVQTAVNGVDAMEKINGTPPALVITDLNMPKMCGNELMQKLRAKYRDQIAIICMTGFVSQDCDNDLLSCYNGRLLKPFGMTELLAMVDEFMPKPDK